MHYKKAMKILRAREPKSVWEKCKGRKYKITAERWYDPAIMSVEFGAKAHTLMNNGLFTEATRSVMGDPESRTAQAFMENSFTANAFFLGAEHDYPTFFVPTKMAEVALLSKATSDVEIGEMHLPHESFTFVFERDTPIRLDLPYGEREPLACLNVTRISPDLAFPKSNRHSAGLEIMFREVDKHFAGGLFLQGVTENMGKACLFLNKVYKAGDELPDNLFDNTADVPHAEILENLAMNLLFIMQARPALVTAGKRVGYHKKSKSEVWSPNVIGLKYKAKTQGDGSHTAVRSHWRRGHFRHQPYGPRDKPKHKVIWIEPMLIHDPTKKGDLTRN